MSQSKGKSKPCPWYMSGVAQVVNALLPTLETHIIIFPFLMSEVHWEVLKMGKGNMLFFHFSIFLRATTLKQ